MSFHATAFICCFNESDILWWTLRHLQEQGIGVHIVDNWSSDGSAEIAHDFKLQGYERFPAEGPSKYYSWRLLLQRVEELAYQSKADWIISHDADEIRRSSRAGESLLDGLARVDRGGYTAVNFQVYHFMPVDDLYVGDPERHFRYYTTGHGDCQMRQVKAWKRTDVKVDLASTGGHFARFPRVLVSPEFFVLKHYPLRTSAQAERKVLRERVGRYDPVERAMRWHVQYDGLAASRQWLLKPEDLTLWNDDQPPRALPCPAALFGGV
jgi:glycosyltransferase involved in cell wall biosynthesis